MPEVFFTMKKILDKDGNPTDEDDANRWVSHYKAGAKRGIPDSGVPVVVDYDLSELSAHNRLRLVEGQTKIRFGYMVDPLVKNGQRKISIVITDANFDRKGAPKDPVLKAQTALANAMGIPIETVQANWTGLEATLREV